MWVWSGAQTHRFVVGVVGGPRDVGPWPHVTPGQYRTAHSTRVGQYRTSHSTTPVPGFLHCTGRNQLHYTPRPVHLVPVSYTHLTLPTICSV
eukprot:1020158-Rhodomonas_salina.1